MPQKERTGLDYTELRRLITIRQVLELVGWRPSKSHGAQLRGPCPIHQSENLHSRTFSVNLEKNVFQCFKSGCSKGNQLDLYAAVTGQALFEAALELCNKLSIEPPTSPCNQTRGSKK